MFSTLRTRFGIPGVISVIALVFAMLGGAYAASNSGSGGKATASAKAKRGPRGPKGPAGPQGPAGPAGSQGAKGDSGSNGTNGSDGSDGADGKSVETGNATVGECSNGGATVQVAGQVATKKKICNGAPGQDGETGFTKTLPQGKTETGVWAYQSHGPYAIELDPDNNPGVITPVDSEANSLMLSFNIPLTTAPKEIVYLKPSETDETKCPSGTVSDPTAAPGYLCVYAELESVNIFRFTPFDKIFKTGVLVAFRSIAHGSISRGTWAVTAE